VAAGSIVSRSVVAYGPDKLQVAPNCISPLGISGAMQRGSWGEELATRQLAINKDSPIL